MAWHNADGCNNKGLMSYGSGIPLQWSQCSKKDFKTYYNHATKVQKLSWCMEGENYLAKLTINNNKSILASSLIRRKRFTHDEMT